MIRLEKVTFQYGSAAPVFQDFSWQAGKGETWAVLGPSGCGKSTLLSLLAGLAFPGSGQVLVDGQPLTRPRPRTGLIIQEYGLLPWATVRQNVELGLRIRHFYGPDGTHAPKDFHPEADVDAWLRRLGLEPVQNSYPGRISGGQRQRTAIARTLALNPDLLLMDEPFSSLDALTREDLERLLLELRAETGVTTLVVTHNIEEAVYLGQRLLVLRRPPHCQPLVVDNWEAGQPGYRQQPEFQARCSQLRALLEESTHAPA